MFAPRYADAVGVYGIATATFDASVSMGSFTMNEVVGGAAVGARVVFAPRFADALGVQHCDICLRRQPLQRRR